MGGDHYASSLSIRLSSCVLFLGGCSSTTHNPHPKLRTNLGLFDCSLMKRRTDSSMACIRSQYPRFIKGARLWGFLTKDRKKWGSR